MDEPLSRLISEVEKYMEDRLSKERFSAGGHIAGTNSRTVYMGFKNIMFDITEVEMGSPLDWSVYHGLIIRAHDSQLGLDSVDVRWKEGDTMTQAVDLRRRALHSAAVKFVNDVLSKLDYAIKRLINNKEIEDILEVLE